MSFPLGLFGRLRKYLFSFQFVFLVLCRVSVHSVLQREEQFWFGKGKFNSGGVCPRVWWPHLQ